MNQTHLDRLRALAIGLCQDDDFRIALHRGGWSWSQKERLLCIDQDDLEALGALPCAGLVAHEMGHALISRYLYFNYLIMTRFPHPFLGTTALNALEDTRVNAWMARRYPGVGRWFEAVASSNQPLWPTDRPMCLTFLLKVAEEGFVPGSEEAPEPLEPMDVMPADLPVVRAIVSDIERALDLTAEARRQYALDYLPPVSLLDGGDPDEWGRAFEAEVAVHLDEHIQDRSFSPLEQHLMVLAARAVQHALDAILPVVRGLWEQDVARIAAHLARSRSALRLARDIHDGRRLVEVPSLVQAAMTTPLDANARSSAEHLSLASLVLYRYLGGKYGYPARWGEADSTPPNPSGALPVSGRRCTERPEAAAPAAPPPPNPSGALPVSSCQRCTERPEEAAPADSTPSNPSGALPASGCWRCVERPEEAAPAGAEAADALVEPDGAGNASEERELRYQDAHAQVAEQVDTMVHRLGQILSARMRLRERGGYSSGTRVELRSAMAAESDPRRLQSMWRRKTVPDRRHAAFSLLVDLSGSMRGGKIRAALCSAALLVETLSRLDIPFEVNGFQDRLIPFIGFGDALDEHTRSRIGQMPLEVRGNCPGGNNSPAYNDDGPCLREAGRRLAKQPVDDRVLVVISDGSPEGRHSDSNDLYDAIQELTRPMGGITLVGVGIGPDTEHVRSFYPFGVGNLPVDRLADGLARILEAAIGRRKVSPHLATILHGQTG